MVHNGGWVIYEKANFKGKFMYHHDGRVCSITNIGCLQYLFQGDCFSNDPINIKGPKLKSWQDPIGSIRPLTGKDVKRIAVTVELDWSKLQTDHEMKVVDIVEGKNNTFNYVSPVWNRVNHIEATVSHW